MSRYKGSKKVSGPLSFKVKHIGVGAFLLIVLFLASVSIGYLVYQKNYNHYYEGYHNSANTLIRSNSQGVYVQENNSEKPKELPGFLKAEEVEECSSYTGPEKELCEMNVLISEAKSKDDPDVCSKSASVEQRCRDEYYTSKAISFKDASYCDKVSSEGRDKCYFNLKVVTGDSSYCEYIKESILKKMCG